MSATVRAAILIGVATIIAAVVTGGFGLLSSKAAEKDESKALSNSGTISGPAIQGDATGVVSGRDTIIHNHEQPRDGSAEEQLNKRTVLANAEYDVYSHSFAAAIKAFADENLEAIFAECIAQVSAQDPSVPLLLTALRALPVGSDEQRDKLRDTVKSKVLPHRQRIAQVIFERFNTRLMDDLRSLASRSEHPWMTRALLEWTHRENDDSWLVQGCITKLLADDNRVGSWLYANIRREQEPQAWDKKSEDAANMRFDLLSTLERLVGNALNDGRQEVIEIVSANFPSNSAVPVYPRKKR